MSLHGRKLALAALAWATMSGAHAQERLRVAYVPFNVPLSFAAGATAENYRKLDPAVDAARGAMIDLLRAMAEDAGLQFRFLPMVAGEQPGALLSGKIDLLTAATERTPEIAAGIVFSAPTYLISEGLIVPKADTTRYKTYRDLRGAIVGGQKGRPSTSGLQKTGLFTAVKVYDSGAELEEAVGRGEVKAGFDSSIYGALAREREDPSVGWHVVESYQPSWIVESAIGARKADTPIIRKLDEVLSKLKRNGTAKAIFVKYGVEGALAK
jgi:polar amino acid transport system substrate-binding protein